jgi:hypothetical protein
MSEKSEGGACIQAVSVFVDDLREQASLLQGQREVIS